MVALVVARIAAGQAFRLEVELADSDDVAAVGVVALRVRAIAAQRAFRLERMVA